MARRQQIWAHKAKLELLLSLGGACRECGAEDRLEFDCIEPIGHHHHRAGFTWRISIYRRQHAQDNLQLLCERCHMEKTKRENASCVASTETESQPF